MWDPVAGALRADAWSGIGDGIGIGIGDGRRQ